MYLMQNTIIPQCEYCGAAAIQFVQLPRPPLGSGLKRYVCGDHALALEQNLQSLGLRDPLTPLCRIEYLNVLPPPEVQQFVAAQPPPPDILPVTLLSSTYDRVALIRTKLLALALELEGQMEFVQDELRLARRWATEPEPDTLPPTDPPPPPAEVSP